MKLGLDSWEQLSDQLRNAFADGIIDENEEKELEKLRKKPGLSNLVALDIRNDIQRMRQNKTITHCPKCGCDFENHY